MRKHLWTIRKRNKENIQNNIGGTVSSVCIMAGILCQLYSVGMLFTENNNDIELLILCVFFAVIIVKAIILLNINFGMARRNEFKQKLFLLKKLEEDEIKLKDSLEREEIRFEKYLDILNECVGKMYLFAEEISISQYEDGDNECANNIISTVIKEKIKRAETLGINIRIKHYEGEELCMNPADCVSIIANLLDNAIEAVANQGKGRINAYFKTDKTEFYCFVENTCMDRLTIIDGRLITTKNDKENHGIGIENVMETVKSYGKNMEIKVEEGLFRVEIK